MSTGSRRNAARQTETIAVWGGGANPNDDVAEIHPHRCVSKNNKLTIKWGVMNAT
jgi:hypothetical protein